ncbi:MAG: HAMP domain-containing sensor histidine kinase [Anaerolineales bacterium]
MLRSLRSRLFLTFLLYAGIIVIPVVLSLIFVVLANLERLEYRRLEVLRGTLDVQQANVLADLPPDRLPQFLDRVDQQADVRIIILDGMGSVLVDSRPGARKIPQDMQQTIVQSDSIERGKFGTLISGSWIFVSTRISNGRWVVLAAPSNSLRRLSTWGNELIQPLLRMGILALVISALLAWLIARWVAAPWSKAAGAARAVAAGDYEQRIESGGPLEAENMALAFNDMVARVQSSRRSQRDFVANVSHELKTPLTSIQGFAQAILDGTAEDRQTIEHAAQVIFDESDRLRRLVEDLLDLARLDAGQVEFQREPVMLEKLVQSVMDRLDLRARENKIELHNQLPVLPTIVGDGDRLAQVFTNLIDNAVDHSPEGGKVTLSADLENGWISIHVADQGPGIPAEELSRIFERFYQLEKSRTTGKKRGAGLGLAISREIVQLHGGRLVAESTLGHGSRFTVRLPIVRPDDKTLIHRRQP